MTLKQEVNDMHINRILRQYVTEERNFLLSSLSETNLVRTSLRAENLNGEQLSVEHFNGAIPFDPAVLLAPIFFLAMAGVVIFHKRKLSRQVHTHQVHRLNSLHKLPCQKCRFFSNNNYLKCTVHPSTVLTKEAINCRDYHPLNKKSIRFSRIYGNKQN